MSHSFDEQAPAKRQRLEAETSITRSSTWHLDGSVVLQAESTQFRVHWSVLSLNSTFFQELQGLPQPLDEQKVEGCPVVELQDSAIDVQRLLDVLYSPLKFGESKLRLSLIGSIIRLGRKYDFKDLLAAAVDRLTYENPQTLGEYEKLKKNDSGAYATTKYILYKGMLLDVIILAHENGLFTLLPCAYLRLFLYTPLETMIEGIDGPYGRVELSVEQQKICVAAKRKIMEVQWRDPDVWSWFSSGFGAQDCTSRTNSCALKKTLLFRTFVVGDVSFIPFGAVPKQLQASMCEACIRRHKEVMAAGRKKMWDELPTFFGLPPWSELKNDL
ncbi:BTB domain-containing protein [Favolaschia claudopus]|uniref:BTB domain-containing protein n=1 Tax=Favolaschia claudopus TaxID=2862362 RepID=A0AAW0DUP0_9AGAR